MRWTGSNKFSSGDRSPTQRQEENITAMIERAPRPPAAEQNDKSDPQDPGTWRRPSADVDLTDHRDASDGRDRRAPSFIPGPALSIPPHTAQSPPTTSRLLSPVLSSTPHAGTRETQGETRARACISIAGASSCDRRSITTAPHPCVSSVFLSYVRLFLCLELAVKEIWWGRGSATARTRCAGPRA